MSERLHGLAMADNAGLVAGYLRSVAATLGQSLQGDGLSAAQLRDCVKTLLRIEQGLMGRDSPATPAPDSPAQWPAALDGFIACHTDIANAFDAAQQQAQQKHELARSFDRERCEAYLRQKTSDDRLRVTQARVLPGGRSKLTVLLEIETTADLPPQLVMRQDWAAGGVQGTTVVTEYTLLSGIAAAGLKVPRPLLIERSGEALGAPFMLVTRMSGATTGDYFTTTATAPVVLDLAEQLGRLHQLNIEDFAAAALPEDPQTSDALAERLAAMATMREQLGDDSTIAAMTLQWLQQHRERVQPQRTLLHNDLGCHNLLVDGDVLSALLDWELASIGHPAADLGYARGWVEKIVPWSTFMQRYEQAGGPAVDAFTLDYYTLWSGLRLYVMMLQAAAGLSKGAIRDLEIAVICADSTPRLLQRMAGDLRRALQSSALEEQNTP